MIDTARVTERRRLEFSTMRDILEDLVYLDSGDPPRATGNWTSAQIVHHVAKLIDYSIDGFPAKAPLPVRLLGRLFRKRVLARPMRPGVKLPQKFAFLVPDRDITWEAAADTLRRAIGRLDSQKMTSRSPVLGKLSPPQWEQLHCRHAELHFSFLHPD